MTARPKIKSQSQIYGYGRSIFCLPHRPKSLGFFGLCLHWVSIVRDLKNQQNIRLKVDVLPETLTPPKIVLPKAKGYYHPLAISFPGFGVFWELNSLKQMVIITP